MSFPPVILSSSLWSGSALHSQQRYPATITPTGRAFGVTAASDGVTRRLYRRRAWRARSQVVLKEVVPKSHALLLPWSVSMGIAVVVEAILRLSDPRSTRGVLAWGAMIADARQRWADAPALIMQCSAFVSVLAPTSWAMAQRSVIAAGVAARGAALMPSTSPISTSRCGLPPARSRCCATSISVNPDILGLGRIGAKSMIGCVIAGLVPPDFQCHGGVQLRWRGDAGSPARAQTCTVWQSILRAA